ncbi:glutamyl-tRNA reductase [Garciella nitratireducens]|nr:glutamyl-tRNA reductase [Garciella nitratireducens]
MILDIRIIYKESKLLRSVKEMEIGVIGVHHKIAPVEIRERVSFTQSQKEEAFSTLKKQGIQEMVILSTCNRSEVYIVTENLKQGLDSVCDFLKYYSGIKNISQYLIIKRNKEAVTHLFKVAAGLESLVLGEDQILGQVKEAHQFAMNHFQSGKVLNKLFRESITMAKYIKHTYKISENPTSVSYTGLKLLKKEIGSMEGKKALIIGAGNIGKLSLMYLLEEPLEKVYITNRTRKRFYTLKEDLNLKDSVVFIPYEDRYKVIKDVDIVISTTASPHIILKKQFMSNLEKKLYILDLAIPRDVDQEIGQMQNINLYDIDHLKKVIDENIAYRHHLRDPILQLIHQGVDDFYSWKQSIKLDKIIGKISIEQEKIKENAINYIERKTDISDKDMKKVEKMINSSLKKTIKPIIELKKIKDQKKLQNYIEMLNDILRM